MKRNIISIIFSSLALIAAAEESYVDEDYKLRDYRLQRPLMESACTVARRRIAPDQGIIDLTQTFRYFTNNLVTVNLRPDWRPVIGHVVQVLDGGIVVQTWELFKIESPPRRVHLRRHPRAAELVDGNIIAVIAMRHGRHQYLNKAGQFVTVENWDYGEALP